MAAVIITGGGGFLGQCLATALLEKGTVTTEKDGCQPLKALILADIYFADTLQPTLSASPIVTKVPGDISNKEYCQSLFDATASYNHISIFHCGAVMSGDGERDFDLCLRVNLYGTMHMLECARATGKFPKMVVCSAGATIGSGAPTDYISCDDTISDATRATPHTTYGATKACSELLLSDYARRGFVNARGLRLPTIVVRAGKPNAATTGCYSGVIREPLSGVDVELPIASHVPHAVTGKRAAIHGMLLIHDAKLEEIERVLGFDRTIFLPAVPLSLGDLQNALYSVVTPDSRASLGKITYKVDEKLSAVVGSFPTKVDASRAQKLGVPEAPDAENLVREYIEDFHPAVVDTIQMISLNTSKERIQADKVAVITGGGSGIGRAAAIRLSKAGWAVVIAGRAMSALQDTKKLLSGAECLCVPTDVSNVKEVVRLFSEAEQRYGKVDLLFNNAGINSAASSFEDVKFSDFERVIKTNVGGPFLCAREAMRVMAKNGGGRIINNGSISAHSPRPGSACYTASKHAVLGLTKCIALDGRKHNVACGQIDFGNVVSEISKATNKPGSGAMQANGTLMEEPMMSMKDAAETLFCMANLPLEANVLQMTVMASSMPFVGRG